jgi:DNA-binding NtrC family response regulator/tetratricopeptide (TPR) repeat protein
MITSASEAFRQGHFRKAAGLLNDNQDIANRVLNLEITYFLGDADRVRRDGAATYAETGGDPLLASRVSTVIASQYFDDGDSATSLDYSQRAVRFAERSGDLRQLAASTCALLERTCIRAAFDASLPLALSARRTSIRCGTAEVACATHLTFARLEARAGHFEAARRHFNLSRTLLCEQSNLLLSACVDLDESSLRSLVGDFAGALEMAKAAVVTSETSGWSKGIVAAAANCAFFSLAIGDLDAASQFVRHASAQNFKSPSYALALDETIARLKSASGDWEDAEGLLRRYCQRTPTIQPWYQLSAAETLIRLLAAQGRWAEALEQAEQGLSFANEIGAEPFIRSMELARVNAMLGLGQDPQTLKLPLVLNRSVWSPGLAGSLYEVLGRAFTVAGSHGTAEIYLRRATRIFQGVSSMTSRKGTTAEAADGTGEVPPPPDLDSAVALIELGGHTHILAREVLAVIDAAQCARGAAVIAVGANGPQVIDRRGWDEAAALAVAKKPASCEVIPLGDHRDEPWQLIVYGKPELEHRCALIAIRKLVGMALTLDRYRREEQQRAALWPAEALDGDPESIWASEQMSEVLTVARRIAPTPLSVLVTGETGTGKEMLARAIHRGSDRADRAMIPFNCTAVPRDMIESQLFGYRRGAFTGADASFAGVIRSAAGGTLFLDEIADIPLDVQPKLLRFLETHEIHPLGEPHPVKVDVRVIVATNAKLEELVADGRFREDLFYRLNVVHLKLPPLRERREEIPPLVEHYLRKESDEQKKGRLTLSDETLEYLLLYAWPGNLRQLANEVRRMVAMAEADSTLTPACLSPEIQASRKTIPAAPSGEPEVRVRIDQPLPAAVELLEQTMVKSALDKTHGRVEEAARILGISRKGLFLKRRRWGLSVQHH